MSQTSTAAPTLPPPPADDPADRRAHPRIPSAHLRVTRVRVAHRTARSVVDLSSGGALLELPFQLRPHSRLSIEIVTPATRVEVPFRLLRCYVADLNGGITYHAAGAFEGLVNVDGLARPESFAVQRLIEMLQRLRRGVDTVPDRSRSDAAFDEVLAETIAGLRRGESLDLVALKVKAQLTRAYPSLLILPATSMPGQASTSVTCFGLTFVTRQTLSAHDRRLLKANAQLISMIEETRRDLHDEGTTHYPSPIVYTAAEWVAGQASPHDHRIAS